MILTVLASDSLIDYALTNGFLPWAPLIFVIMGLLALFAPGQPPPPSFKACLQLGAFTWILPTLVNVVLNELQQNTRRASLFAFEHIAAPLFVWLPLAIGIVLAMVLRWGLIVRRERRLARGQKGAWPWPPGPVSAPQRRHRLRKTQR